MRVSEVAMMGRISRRRALAFGAAALASAALAACGGGSSATDTPKPAAGGTQVPAGVVATAQAIASSVPGGAAAIASAVPGGAATIASAVPGGAAALASAVPGGGAAVAPAVPAASPAAAGAAPNAAEVAKRNEKYKNAPPLTIDKAKKYIATIVTNKGTMKAELYADTAPMSVNSFVFLANDHFFDGIIFHRVVAGFVIQGGDPTGTGTGGPGYKFPDEPGSFSRNYEKGTLAMANSGPNTNGSQFFICVDNLTATNALPKKYNIFGKVTEGLDTIDKILAVPRTVGGDGAQSKPTQQVFMQTVTILLERGMTWQEENNQYAGQGAPKFALERGKTYTAKVETSMGDFTAELYSDTAPMTVNSFVFLANEGFYDGVVFHRVVPGFVVQGGDPTGSGSGGPGYKFADEDIPQHRDYEKGTLAMANSGPNTNGSQFFVCVADLRGRLPKQYTIFGKVNDGIEVVDSMVAVPLLPGGDGARSKPASPITINKVTISED